MISLVVGVFFISEGSFSSIIAFGFLCVCWLLGLFGCLVIWLFDAFSLSFVRFLGLGEISFLAFYLG